GNPAGHKKLNSCTVELRPAGSAISRCLLPRMLAWVPSGNRNPILSSVLMACIDGLLNVACTLNGTPAAHAVVQPAKEIDTLGSCAGGGRQLPPIHETVNAY